MVTAVNRRPCGWIRTRRWTLSSHGIRRICPLLRSRQAAIRNTPFFLVSNAGNKTLLIVLLDHSKGHVQTNILLIKRISKQFAYASVLEMEFLGMSSYEIYHSSSKLGSATTIIYPRIHCQQFRRHIA